jgi:hypothetical protein
MVKFNTGAPSKQPTKQNFVAETLPEHVRPYLHNLNLQEVRMERKARNFRLKSDRFQGSQHRSSNGSLLPHKESYY